VLCLSYVPFIDMLHQHISFMHILRLVPTLWIRYYKYWIHIKNVRSYTTMIKTNHYNMVKDELLKRRV